MNNSELLYKDSHSRQFPEHSTQVALALGSCQEAQCRGKKSSIDIRRAPRPEERAEMAKMQSSFSLDGLKKNLEAKTIGLGAPQMWVTRADAVVRMYDAVVSRPLASSLFSKRGCAGPG